MPGYLKVQPVRVGGPELGRPRGSGSGASRSMVRAECDLPRAGLLREPLRLLEVGCGPINVLTPWVLGAGATTLCPSASIFLCVSCSCEIVCVFQSNAALCAFDVWSSC